MLKGILVVNGCMRTPKFEFLTKMYEEAAQKYSIDLQVAYNNGFVVGTEAEGFVYHGCMEKALDFVLFLDKDIPLAKQLENKGIRVFNGSRVIAICDDKGATCMALQGKGITMPKTIIAPLIYKGTYREEDGYIELVERELGYPIIVKECFGSFGEQVYKVENREQLVAKRRELAEVPHLYQEMIESSYGRDVRVQVVGGEVVAAMLRYSDTDFRANISSGGQMKAWELDKSFEACALQVCQVLGADFAGVDLLFGPQGEPIVCEVNSNAHIKNIYDCTGVNVAEKIFAYIEKELKK